MVNNRSTLCACSGHEQTRQGRERKGGKKKQKFLVTCQWALLAWKDERMELLF